MTSPGLGGDTASWTCLLLFCFQLWRFSRRRAQHSWAHLAKRSCSGIGAEEAAESARSPVLPAVGPGPDAGQRATDLPESVRRRNIRLPQELCHVLPPSRLTLTDRGKKSVTKKQGNGEKCQNLYFYTLRILAWTNTVVKVKVNHVNITWEKDL